MPGNKKPRKPRKPRLVWTNPFNSIMAKLDDEGTRQIKLIPHQELAEIREGRGTEHAWDTLACRINWASVLACNIQFEEDLKPVFREALDALRSLAERARQTGKYVATGDELRAIGLALTTADDIQEVTTRREHRDAFVTVLQVAT